MLWFFSLTVFPCNMEVIPVFNVATFIQFIEKISSGFVGNVEEHVSAIEKCDC